MNDESVDSTESHQNHWKILEVSCMTPYESSWCNFLRTSSLCIPTVPSRHGTAWVCGSAHRVWSFLHWVHLAIVPLSGNVLTATIGNCDPVTLWVRCANITWLPVPSTLSTRVYQCITFGVKWPSFDILDFNHNPNHYFTMLHIDSAATKSQSGPS